jgi:hypothetical protein
MANHMEVSMLTVQSDPLTPLDESAILDTKGVASLHIFGSAAKLNADRVIGAGPQYIKLANRVFYTATSLRKFRDDCASRSQREMEARRQRHQKTREVRGN